MKARLHPLARREMFAAAEWYEAETDRDDRLVDAVWAAMGKLEGVPYQGVAHRRFADVRVLALRGLPFTLPYRIVDDEIQIIAVAHTSRRPDYWSRRITPAEPRAAGGPRSGGGRVPVRRGRRR